MDGVLVVSDRLRLGCVLLTGRLQQETSVRISAYYISSACQKKRISLTYLGAVRVLKGSLASSNYATRQGKYKKCGKGSQEKGRGVATLPFRRPTASEI